jgi:hypothetical protein
MHRAARRDSKCDRLLTSAEVPKVCNAQLKR